MVNLRENSSQTQLYIKWSSCEWIQLINKNLFWHNTKQSNRHEFNFINKLLRNAFSQPIRSCKRNFRALKIKIANFAFIVRNAKWAEFQSPMKGTRKKEITGSNRAKSNCWRGKKHPIDFRTELNREYLMNHFFAFCHPKNTVGFIQNTK